MTRFSQFLIAVVAALALAAAPVVAQEQARPKGQSGQSGSRGGAGKPSSGVAAPRPAGPSGGQPTGAGASRPAGPSRVGARPAGPTRANPVRSRPAASNPRTGARAVPSNQLPTRSRTATTGGTVAARAGSAEAARPPADREVPQYSRPRGNRPAVGGAVQRPPGRPGYPSYPVQPGYPGYPGGWWSYPWYGYGYPYYGSRYGYPYYGSFGLGFFYYDPYWWGHPGFSFGGYYGTSDEYLDTGKLRLKVKPRHAQVFVNGYYVGIVDEFDGTFQRLRLDSGGHRIEIRADGFEPLAFDVLIPPGETITYRGELIRQP